MSFIYKISTRVGTLDYNDLKRTLYKMKIPKKVTNCKIKNTMKNHKLILSLLLTSISCFAADSELEYPELLVVPRASARLDMEAKRENTRAWTQHLPIQVSSLVTLAAGIQNYKTPDPSKDPDGKAGLGGILVGAGWIGTTLAMSAWYRPYETSWKEMGTSSSKSTRDLLTRERLSEESLEAPARLGKRLMWISTLTNFGVSAYMATKATSSSLGQVTSFISCATAFAPLIFTYHWQRVASDHQQYKKRIYGPVAAISPFFIQDGPTAGRLASGVGFHIFY